jgi:catechol-2,3-dioxygenase
VVEGAHKRLHHLSFACYGNDLARLKARIEANGVKRLDPAAGFASNDVWFRDPAGMLIELKVAAKSSPDRKTSGPCSAAKAWLARHIGAMPPRCAPRRLSHVLIFTPDIDAAITFYAGNLGLRLSDRTRSRGGIPFNARRSYCGMETRPRLTSEGYGGGPFRKEMRPA